MPANQRAVVREAAQRAGINPAVLWGVFGTETNFGRNTSTSSAGAVGPFQFLPGTARSLGINPLDFRSAAFGAAKYLAQFKGRGTAGMLSAYNAGPAGGEQPSYVASVLRNARQWGSGPTPGEASAAAAARTGEPGASATATYTPGPERIGIQQGAQTVNPQALEAIKALLAQAEPKRSAAAEIQPRRPISPRMALPQLAGGVGAVPPLAPKPEPSLSQKITPLLEQLSTQEPSRVVGEGREPGSLSLNVSPSGAPNSLANAVPRGAKLRGFLPANAALTVKRIDQGQDLQTNPGGPILAPGAGRVIAVPSNPGGFGTSYPVVHFDSGPLAGHDVYIGHTRSALPSGARFGAGQVLSRTQHGSGPFAGNANTPGWAEIGLWPPGSMSAGRQIAPLLGLRA